MEIPDYMIGDGEYFVFRVGDDSMKDEGILDGDLLIVRKGTLVSDAQVYVEVIDSKPMLKRCNATLMFSTSILGVVVKRIIGI